MAPRLCRLRVDFMLRLPAADSFSDSLALNDLLAVNDLIVPCFTLAYGSGTQLRKSKKLTAETT